MSKQIESNSRYRIFAAKTAACLFSLIVGFFVLAPQASMQTDDVVVTNANLTARMNATYKPTPEPPKSNVRGRVIYADTGGAVRRAGLMLMRVKGSGGRDNTGLTNERGEFEIKGVTEGRYFVSVSTPGVVSPFSSLTNFERAELKESSTAADIAKDFQEVVVNGINDTETTIIVKRGAAISGRIIYSDGEAAIGVRVEILRKKAGQYNAVVPNISEIFGAMFGASGGMKTDDRGVFRVAGLPAGDYIVRVVENVSHSEQENNRDNDFMAMSGFNPSSMVATYYPNTDEVKKAEIIKVELGQEQSEINITIPERNLQNLSGTVINKVTKAPLKGARVSIKAQNEVNSLFSNSREFGSKNETDEQGRWNYKELPVGKYTLKVQPPYDYEISAERNSQKAKTPKFAPFEKEIVIEEKDVSEVVVELGYGATISGTVTVENGQNLPARTSVSVNEAEGKSSASDSIESVSYDTNGTPVKAAPKKSGDFKIEGLAAGKFYFDVSNSFYGEAEKKEEFYVKSILYAGRELTDKPFEIKEAEDLKGVQIVLSKDVGRVKGKVSKSDKTAAVGAKIYFVPTDEQKWGNLNSTIFSTTDSSGEFEASGAPGEYFLFFLNDEDLNGDEGKTIADKRHTLFERKTKGAQKVTFKAKETEKVDLILPEN